MLKGDVLSSLDLFINLRQTYILHILHVLQYRQEVLREPRRILSNSQISTKWTVRNHEVITHCGAAFVSLYLY